MSATKQRRSEFFLVERHGDVAVLIPTPEVENLSEAVIEQAAKMVMAPLMADDGPTSIVIDLGGVRYFGSIFITFLLRCFTLVKQRGGELVIAGANQPIRELLRMMNLDTLWAVYDSRSEAIVALSGD